MTEANTFGDLFQSKAILEADLMKAVDAYLADQATKHVTIGEGFTVDLVAAVEACPFAKIMMLEPANTTNSKRSAARMAIVLGRPTKA